MPPLRSLALGLLAATAMLAPLATARAADLDENYGYAEAPQEVPAVQSKVEFGTGWYVRGDLGVTRLPGVTSTDPALGSAPDLTLESSSKVGYAATLGAGYQILPWLRSDVTADFHQPIRNISAGAPIGCVEGFDKYITGYSSTSTTTPPTTSSTLNFDGTTTVTSTPAATTVSQTPNYDYKQRVQSCSTQLVAKIHSYDVLANAYLDLYHWHGITPYVGAGVGLAFGYYSASANYFQSDGTSYNVSFIDPRNMLTYHYFYDQSKSGNFYNFAFALMAGFSVDVLDHTKLDINYRYLNQGKVLNATLDSHEVRAGLRYMIDN